MIGRRRMGGRGGRDARGGVSLLSSGPREKTETTSTTVPVTAFTIPAKADAAFAFATTMTTATATAATMRTMRDLLVGRDGLDLCAALFGPGFQNRRGGLLGISWLSSSLSSSSTAALSLSSPPWPS